MAGPQPQPLLPRLKAGTNNHWLKGGSRASKFFYLNFGIAVDSLADFAQHELQRGAKKKNEAFLLLHHLLMVLGALVSVSRRAQLFHLLVGLFESHYLYSSQAFCRSGRYSHRVPGTRPALLPRSVNAVTRVQLRCYFLVPKN